MIAAENLLDPLVPKSLRIWFVIHFFADMCGAIPLLVFPNLLVLFGWQFVDPIATRIVAAALFGIGIESFLGRNARVETFKNMLNLKIIWSGATIIGLIVSLGQSSRQFPWGAWGILAIFLAFHILWFYWRVHIGRVLKTKN